MSSSSSLVVELKNPTDILLDALCRSCLHSAE